MMSKMRTVYKTRKDHECLDCGKVIPAGSMCSYGVTTDPDVTGNILAGYFCTTCWDVAKNTPQV